MSPSGQTTPGEHIEATCEQCGGANVLSWWVDHEMWNEATDGLANGRGAILCPSCFVAQWQAVTGNRATWKLERGHTVGDVLADLPTAEDWPRTEPQGEWRPVPKDVTYTPAAAGDAP